MGLATLQEGARWSHPRPQWHALGSRTSLPLEDPSCFQAPFHALVGRTMPLPAAPSGTPTSELSSGSKSLTLTAQTCPCPELAAGFPRPPEQPTPPGSQLSCLHPCMTRPVHPLSPLLLHLLASPPPCICSRFCGLRVLAQALESLPWLGQRRGEDRSSGR